MARVYKFSAGPAVLPEEVLLEAAAEMLDYNGTGMGVMEMSHRSKAYQQILDTAGPAEKLYTLAIFLPPNCLYPEDICFQYDTISPTGIQYAK